MGGTTLGGVGASGGAMGGATGGATCGKGRNAGAGGGEGVGGASGVGDQSGSWMRGRGGVGNVMRGPERRCGETVGQQQHPERPTVAASRRHREKSRVGLAVRSVRFPAMWEGMLSRAASGRVAGVVFAGALTGCALLGSGQPAPAATPPPQAAPAPAAPRLRATVVPPEVEIFEGRLYATVWLNQAADAPVEIRLQGQNAPATVATIAPGQQACAGLDFDTSATDGTWSVRHDQACSWDATTLAPGAYTFEVASGGQRIGSYTFTLMEVAASGAELSLAVDPESRVGMAYLHPAGLAYWMSVDARWESRPVSFVFFSAMQHVATRTAQVEGPRLRGGGTPLSAVRPVLLRDPPRGQSEWYLAAFVDEDLLGAWHYGHDRRGRMRGIRVIRGTDLGPLANDSLPPAILERARTEVAGRVSIERPERRICALAALPEAADLVARAGDSEAETFRRIDRLAARYSDGCLDTMLQ